MSRGILIAAIIIGAILFSGLLYGAFGVAYAWLVHGELPKGEWWHFAVAIPIIGIVALSFEAVGEGIRHAFGAHKPRAPKWREALAVVTIIAAAIGILVTCKLLRS